MVWLDLRGEETCCSILTFKNAVCIGTDLNWRYHHFPTAGRGQGIWGIYNHNDHVSYCWSEWMEIWWRCPRAQGCNSATALQQLHERFPVFFADLSLQQRTISRWSHGIERFLTLAFQDPQAYPRLQISRRVSTSVDSDVTRATWFVNWACSWAQRVCEITIYYSIICGKFVHL
jgi:hypothetical protein